MLVFFIFFLTLFLILIILIYLLSIFFYFSKIKIEIIRLKIKKQKNEKIQFNDFKIKIALTLGKIKWLKITISKEKITNSNVLKNFSINSFKKSNFLKNDNMFKVLKNLNINLETFDLNLYLGLDNIVVLSYITAVINILLSITLAKAANRDNNKNYYYKITPCNTEEIFLKLSINCIFSIKAVNIINILLKERGKTDYGTSNRIFNGNSHEQYPRYGGRKYYNRRTNIYR